MNNKKKIHFIGINGSGIAGVACIAKSCGFDVSGCDKNETSDYTPQLKAYNIPIFLDHDVKHIENVDLVVTSPALLYKDKYKDIEETRVAMEHNKLIKWQTFLGNYIFKDNIIAISGTHGKTTTATLLSLMLEAGNFDPTVVIGGVVKEWEKTYRVGKSNYYVCEADEYDGNFLHYFPKYVILNNLEMEHPERFANFEEYKNNFRLFVQTIQSNGRIIFWYDDLESLKFIQEFLPLFKEKNIEIIGCSMQNQIDVNKKLHNIKIQEIQKDSDSIRINNEIFQFKLLGEHNIKNIAIATTLALNLGVNIEAIKKVLNNFTGSKRRMDLIFSNQNIKLYDDYAHHHTQIQYTLQAIKEKMKKNEKLIAILEPHLISRIKNNSEEYKKSLLLADFPIITKIFKSREIFLDDIDLKSLLNEEKIIYIEDYEDVVNRVAEIISLNNEYSYSIVVMGAGNSYKIAEKIKIRLYDKYQ